MVRDYTDDDDDDDEACDVDVVTCCTLKPLNSLYPIRKLHYPQGRVGPGNIEDRKTKQPPDQLRNTDQHRGRPQGNISTLSNLN